MENIKTRLFSYVFILTLAILVTACGSSTERRIDEGNQAFQDEAYLVALQAYKEAEAQSPDLAEPHYNAANALYKEGAFADASSELSSALDLVEHADLEEYGLFNLGNTAYNLDDLESAIAAYTEALLLNPEDQDAKYNLELAQLSQDQQEQEQNEEQEDNEGDSSDENQNQGEGEDSEDNSDSDQGDSSNSDEEPSSGEESNESSEQSDDPGQQDDNKKDDGSDGEDAENGSPDQSNGSPQDGDEQGQSGSYILEPGERMSEEQARQLLAAIAGNSETLMEKLEQIFFVPFRAPIQDW